MINKMLAALPPAGLKAALLILATLALASLTVSAVYYHGKYGQELARHEATRAELGGRLALEKTTSSLLTKENTALRQTADGLRLQVGGLRESLKRERAAAINRDGIVQSARAAPSKPEGVVDDETSRRIVNHLNDTLQRRRLRGAGDTPAVNPANGISGMREAAGPAATHTG